MRGRKAIPLLISFGLLAAMGTLTTYSVTLYRLFCQATGYGGTTGIATGPSGQVLDRFITIRFNADIDPRLPWRFEPAQDSMKVRVGEPALAFFRAASTASAPVTGQAVFNVTPDKAGLYFDKIDCFCFTRQTLQPGQQVDMPVRFFIDPAIAKDRKLDDVTTITLSYTFFRAPGDAEATPVRSAALDRSAGPVATRPAAN
jgi:cytochrome c oxidase assembly protein subunit 11